MPKVENPQHAEILILKYQLQCYYVSYRSMCIGQMMHCVIYVCRQCKYSLKRDVIRPLRGVF